MGISIDLHIYNTHELLAALKAWGAIDDGLTRKILEKCGTFFGDSYVLLNNEYYDGYSPYYNVAHLLNRAFGGSDDHDSFDIFCFEVKSVEGINAVEEGEVADELGLPDRSDDDD
jgi:hypothetical protein